MTAKVRPKRPDPEKDLSDPSVPIEPSEAAWIVQEVAVRKERENISYRVLGLALHYSGATVSQVLAGKYGGHTDAVLREMARWLRDRSGRPAVTARDYAETTVGALMRQVCDRAWYRSGIGLIAVPSGWGKTTVLTEVARRRGRQTVLLRVGETLTTVRGLLTELVDRLGARVSSRPTADEMARSVRARLAEAYAGGSGSPFCILVDEATRIKGSPMNMLREFCDDPACRAALVLAGTSELQVLVSRRTWIPGGTDQVRRRIVASYCPPPGEGVPAADVEAVVRSILTAMGWKGRFPRTALSYLVDVAAGDGALGAVANRLYAVADVAEAVGVAPRFTAEELDYAGTLLFHQPRKWPDRSNPFGRVGKDEGSGDRGIEASRKTA